MKPGTSTPASGRRIIAALWGATLMPFLVLALWVPLVRATGVADSMPVAAIVALAVIAGAALGGTWPGLAAQLPEDLDDWLAPENRRLAALWSLGGLVALFALARMAVFLGDARCTWASIVPDDSFLVRHSCLTAYMHGAILSLDPSANVYDMAFVDGAKGGPLPATAAHFEPFMLDAYGYPPPFLLLPRAMLLLSRDFLVQRMAFSAASLALAFLACARMAKLLGGLAARRIWLLTPLLLASPPVLVVIQIGNFHLAAVALCVLCWVAAERRQDGLAGGLLAVTVLSKIFPGLLGVVFLVQRRWRLVGATIVAATALMALSAAVLGTQVWRDFLLYHLPRVQTGEALRFMAENPREIAYNLAPFGIPFKLNALGLVGWSWTQARTFGNVYTLLLFVLAVLAGLNKGSPQHRLTVWLALVMLASLRSPYAAPFVLVTVILLLLSMAAEVRSARGVAGFLGMWALVSILPPVPDPRAAIALSLVQFGAIYALLVWFVLRRGQPVPDLSSAAEQREDQVGQRGLDERPQEQAAESDA
jgi:hypothetical protein